MGVRWGRLGVCVLLAVAVVVLVGCGGSGSSGAERTKLANQVSAQLKGSSAPQDLIACLRQQSQVLPIAQLRTLATAGPNPPLATKQIGVRLFATCIRQGKGLAPLHALIVQGIVRSSGGAVPAALTNCLVAKANATTPAQMSRLISAYAAQDGAQAQAQARQVGIGLADQCFATSAVRTALRVVFLAPIERKFAAGTYSAAFRDCFLRKARRAPFSLLTQAALDPAGAQLRGEAFGRNAAKACIASGAKP